MAAVPLPQGLVPPRLLSRVTSDDADVARFAAGELFSRYVEPLCDAFSSEAVRRYVSLFTEVVAHCRALPAFERFDRALTECGLRDSESLLSRYEKLRVGPSAPSSEPRRLYFLSRVTLGADVAVTSVLVRYFRARYPDAELVLAGSAKLGELYAADSALRLLETPYVRRGTLAERCNAWVALQDMLAADAQDLAPGEWAVVDPDSRLTQLGLLPAGPNVHRHWFFPSREFGEDRAGNLATLAREWLSKHFGPVAQTPRPYVAPPLDAQLITRMQTHRDKPFTPKPRVAVVNFGTGGNPDKGAGTQWESAVIRALGQQGYQPILDAGLGGEERARAAAVLDAASVESAELFFGSIAELAALIAQADVYVGYDSAGAHLAAAAGVSCVDIFYQRLSARHQDRWTPESTAAVHVVTVEPGDGIEKVVAALP